MESKEDTDGVAVMIVKVYFSRDTARVLVISQNTVIREIKKRV
jgi:hypothetical protein